MKPSQVPKIPTAPSPDGSERAERAADLAGALHEVSNSLTVVLGWLERAIEEPEVAREALAIARAHAQSGHRVARTAIGARVPDEAPKSAADVASEAMTAVACEAQRKGVTLVAEREDAPSPSLDSASAAVQILLNLLLNAIAFTPSGCSVSLAWSVAGEKVVFKVHDQGPGLEAERAGPLFSGPASTRPGGAGIGLTHSVNLARDKGGTLMLLRTGPGASFALEWPVGEAASRPRQSDVAPALVESWRLLVLEDDSAVAGLIELSLGARGADVLVVSDLVALRALPDADRRVDAVLVDLSPLSSEYFHEDLAELRRLVGRATPLVLTTGRASPLPPGAERDFAAWVRKPFDMSELTQVLTEVVRASS